MIGFLLLLLLINVINLCLLISILKTFDNNVDLFLDIEREIRALKRIKRGRK